MQGVKKTKTKKVDAIERSKAARDSADVGGKKDARIESRKERRKEWEREIVSLFRGGELFSKFWNHVTK